MFRSRFSALPAIVLLSIAAAAQRRDEHVTCDFDFRPIGAHGDIPAGAVYADPKASAETRAADLVKRLSFDEKLALTGGVLQMYFPGVPRLGVPPVRFADATQGVHEKNICIDITKTTAFPSGQSLAATWNRDLARRYAAAIGEETRAWGIQVLLGPAFNLYRNSEGGRNFEYFGEDPYLAGQIGVSYIRGLQATGTMATAKHFIGNEQEFVRHVADVQIPERALREIYLPPFYAALHDGGALAVMTGNNLVNGHPGAADTPLEQGVLREEWGYRGVIMSDWANSMYWPKRIAEEPNSGHSLLMENNDIFAKWIKDEIVRHPDERAKLETEIGRMVEENFYSFFKAGVYDRPNREESLLAKIDSHQAIAREVAEESITLLKNEDGILPLEPAQVSHIAIVGTDEALEVYDGRGSGAVKGYDHVDFLAGMSAAYGSKASRVDEKDEATLRSATAVVLMINKPAGENIDVPYDIPGLDDRIARLAASNRNLVVVFSGGNGFPVPWLPKVKALVFGYLLGQQRGIALAEVLSGEVNPSGKLPFTMEKQFADSPAYEYNKLPDGTYGWSGSREGSMKASKAFGDVPVRYDEGIFMGYRWYDHKSIQPSFPFGFGLSYTTFRYGRPILSATKLSANGSLTASFTLTNTGKRAGKEVAQLYVHAIDPKVERATKELKAFDKIAFAPGETKAVTLTVSANDLRYWDPATHTWKIDHGAYEVWIGSSSANILGRAKFSY